MVSAILFDFNGVIIDDEPQHCDALIATLAEYGVPLDRETYYRDYLGFDDRECFRFTFERLGARSTSRASRRRSSASTALRPRAPRRPCAWCRARRTSSRPRRSTATSSAIVSGALRREIELVLDLAGLRAPLRRDRRGGGRQRLQAGSAGLSTRLRETLDLPAARCVVDRGLPARPRRRPRRRHAVRHAHHLASRGRLRRDRRWSGGTFVGHAPAELPWAHA